MRKFLTSWANISFSGRIPFQWVRNCMRKWKSLKVITEYLNNKFCYYYYYYYYYLSPLCRPFTIIYLKQTILLGYMFFYLFTFWSIRWTCSSERTEDVGRALSKTAHEMLTDDYNRSTCCQIVLLRHIFLPQLSRTKPFTLFEFRKNSEALTFDSDIL